MKRKFLIALNIILFLIFIGEIVLITINFPYKNPAETVVEEAKPVVEKVPQITPVATIVQFDESNLPKNFAWTTVSLDDQDSLYQEVKDSPLYVNSETVKIDFTGNEWLFERTDLNESESSQIATQIEDYYNDYFDNAGWKSTLETSELRIQTLSADGPTGSIWGYVVQDGERIRFVLLERSNILPGEKMNETCPCSTSFRIFVSNPITIGDIKSSLGN